MRILAIRYSGLGDIVMLLPTLKKLKEKYSSAHITLLTDKSNAQMLSLSCGAIDDVIPFNRGFFRQKRIVKSLFELLKLFKNIRKKYDICIDFQNFGETATISYLSNAKKKIGMPKNKKYNYGYTDIVKNEDECHRSQRFARVAQVSDKITFPKLCTNQKLEIAKKAIVGINIGSTQESRRWSEKSFATVAKALIDSQQYDVKLFIGPMEKGLKKSFETLDLKVVENVDLVELAKEIETCSYFISNDTGPVHIAAGLGVAILTLFSTGWDSDVGALTQYKTFIRKEKINDITPDEVLEKFSQLTAGIYQDD